MPMLTGSPFATPAGVATGTMNMPNGSSLDLHTKWSQQEGTLNVLSPFHQARPNGVVPSGWQPKEASPKPNYDCQAAGMCSYIDNTMRISPIKPFWGQTRQLSRVEGTSPYRVLPEHTLTAIKAPHGAPHLESPEAMASVLNKYAPAVPVFDYKYDPSRLNSGFISSPSLGHSIFMNESRSSPTLSPQTPSPNADPSSTFRKFNYDQTAGLAHIPVARRTLML